MNPHICLGGGALFGEFWAGKPKWGAAGLGSPPGKRGTGRAASQRSFHAGPERRAQRHCGPGLLSRSILAEGHLPIPS